MTVRTFPGVPTRTAFLIHATFTLLLWTICASSADAQEALPDFRNTEQGNILYKDNERWIRERFAWFMASRTYPTGRIPEGAREAAWKETQSLPVYNPPAALAKGAGSAMWTQAGPINIGGRVTGVAIHPTDHNIVYFTAADGGVWKSTDGGSSFVPVADNLPTMAMGSIEIDPSDPNTLYVGTGEANGSADSYGGVGVAKSTDAGATWSMVSGNFAQHIGKIRVNRAERNIVYAATRQGLFRSVNSGVLWTKVYSGVTHDVVLHPTKPNTLFAAVQGVGVIRSVDTGATWTELSIGVAKDSVGRLALDLCWTQPDIMYCVIVNGRGTSNLKAIVKSTNGGDTWVRTSSASTPNFFSTYGWYLCDIAVHPTNPNRILSGGVGLYMSTDGGFTWTTRSGMHVDQHAIEFSISNPAVMYLGNDGGMYRSNDNGTTYTSLNDDLPITQFYELGIGLQDPNLMGGGTQDNGSKLRRKDLTNWDQATGGDGGYFVIDYSDSSYMWAEYQNGSHMRTTNGGTNWISANSGIIGSGLWVTPVAIHPTNPQVLYTASTKKLYKTTNRGALWFQFHGNLDSASTINHIALSPKNPDLIVVGYSNGKVWKSPNAGGTWVNISTGLPSRTCEDIIFDPNDVNTFYTCFGGYAATGIYKTVDAGTTWTSITGNLPSIQKNCLEINPNNPAMLYVGTDLGVYATTDSGRTWAVLGSGMPKCVVADLELHPKSGVLLAATHGRSVYQLSVTTPVEFTSFSAVQDGRVVRLAWRTSSETNNAGYSVERLETRGGTWEEIGFVAGKGSSPSVNLYSFVDERLPALAETLVYRLRQLDTDGSHTYSHEVLVTLARADAADFSISPNYPNPFVHSTTLHVTLPVLTDTRVTVTDAAGRVVAVLHDGALRAGAHAFTLDARALESGVYFCRVEAGGRRLARAMTLLK